MKKVTNTILPLQSALNDRVKPTDFIDCYSVESDLSPRDAAEIITNFPAWARYLVKIRNVVTTPFSLKVIMSLSLDLTINIWTLECLLFLRMDASS
jgi:hypothetical protein